MCCSFKKKQTMKRYKIMKIIGDGTFGSVAKAVNNETGEIVCSILCFSN